MMISFRTKLFDASGQMPEGTFRGEELARWLSARLVGWQTDMYAEDWGWAIEAKKSPYRYLIGVYDHDSNDVTENGPKWVIRLFNERDYKQWLRDLIKYTPPAAHEVITQEIVHILKQAGDIKEVCVEPLD